MATYSALYPASNLTQQLIGHKGRLEEVDFKQVARFFIYGGFIHANIVFQWLAFIGKTFPRSVDLCKIILFSCKSCNFSTNNPDYLQV